MSDSTSLAAPRTPDQFVKRATTLSQSTAAGLGGSAVALVALWINESLQNGWQVPSSELIIVLLGFIVPAFQLIHKVIAAKLNAWAKSQGVEP